MFNPSQRGGRGTLLGDIDKVTHTHTLSHARTQQIGGAAGGKFEAFNTGLTVNCVGRRSFFVLHKLSKESQYKGLPVCVQIALSNYKEPIHNRIC